MHIVTGENIKNELETISNLYSDDVISKFVIAKETYMANEDKDLYRLVSYEGEQGNNEKITIIERPNNLRLASDRRCYRDNKGHLHVFTKVIYRNREVLEYFDLDDQVVKYSLEGYLNALQTNNRRERNALMVEFISDREFFESNSDKKMFTVKGQEIDYVQTSNYETKNRG